MTDFVLMSLGSFFLSVRITQIRQKQMHTPSVYSQQRTDFQAHTTSVHVLVLLLLPLMMDKNPPG